MGLERLGLVLAFDPSRDLYGLCVFGFGGIDEAPAGFFHQPHHQLGACLWDLAGSGNFWRERKNDRAVLPGNGHHSRFRIDLSSAQLLE